MTISMDIPLDRTQRISRALRGYLDAVAAELGVGPESCTVDLDTPVSAYLALDWRLPEFPDRDLALLWDERHGWSAGIETHSGEDLIVHTYLGGETPVPSPRVVARFAAALREGRDTGRLTPPELREPGDDDLVDRLGEYAAPLAGEAFTRPGRGAGWPAWSPGRPV